MNQFAEFNNYINSPVAVYKDELYNLPFNMNTFSKMWNIRTPQEAKEIIEKQRKETGITDPQNLEEQALFLGGRDIYEKLIKGYTEKQWGRKCTELPAFIIKRLPFRFVYDNNYFNDRYQGIPVGGYTKMVANLLDGIEVRLNDEIKDVSAFGKEPVIIATGAIPRLLKRVPGYEKMVEACEYLRGSKGVGQTVAVIGGGLTGSEIAYELALQGKNPVIVEMKDDLISQKGVCLANSSYLREWFELHKVPVYLETTLKEVKDGAIVCTGKDGKDIEIKCDSVISCAGYIPAPVAEKGGKRHLVGDCDKVGNLRTVVWNAYETAMKI